MALKVKLVDHDEDSKKVDYLLFETVNDIIENTQIKTDNIKINFKKVDEEK